MSSVNVQEEQKRSRVCQGKVRDMEERNIYNNKSNAHIYHHIVIRKIGRSRTDIMWSSFSSSLRVGTVRSAPGWVETELSN